MNEQDWIWGNVHKNEYANLPWSKTPLKFLFHREISTFGNTNTPHVSKISYKKAFESGKFTSSHVAGFKTIIQQGTTADSAVNLYSIDTGNDGNLFAGNYFSMNENHLGGKLHTMYFGHHLA
jgi:hypothetical protein